MTALMRFNKVYWMLIVVFVVIPAVALAQEKPAPSVSAQSAKDQPKAVKAEVSHNEGSPAEPKAEDGQIQVKEEPAKPPKDKVISGMSILGNQEAPKSLVIVPWKSSEIGASIGISTVLDDSKKPVDKEVFMRALSYYEIKSGTKQ